jgi:hypothetical protein
MLHNFEFRNARSLQGSTGPDASESNNGVNGTSTNSSAPANANLESQETKVETVIVNDPIALNEEIFVDETLGAGAIVGIIIGSLLALYCLYFIFNSFLKLRKSR